MLEIFKIVTLISYALVGGSNMESCLSCTAGTYSSFAGLHIFRLNNKFKSLLHYDELSKCLQVAAVIRTFISHWSFCQGPHRAAHAEQDPFLHWLVQFST